LRWSVELEREFDIHDKMGDLNLSEGLPVGQLLPVCPPWLKCQKQRQKPTQQQAQPKAVSS
jgi:hypothetical protein